MRDWHRIALALALIALIFVGKEYFLAEPFLKAQEAIGNAIEEVQKEISTPPPLVGREEAPDAYLTRVGVIWWTNQNRAGNGALPPLGENDVLDAVAVSRLEDMFAKQYFDHVSPSGDSASATADQLGYEYIAIGENIALGNFEDDETLVRAWMASPGHRANILSTHYEEIGVAVGNGTFQGRQTWIGVQIFGKPLASCPQPDDGLRDRIEETKLEIGDLEVAANVLRAEIESMRPRTRQEREEYNQLVDDYNDFVSEINALVARVKAMIQDYNSQVERLNSCIAA